MARVGRPAREDVLEKYEMMGVVGEGSYGTVHKARNKESGQIVAIKKFLEEDSNSFKIARRELRALRQLRHENLVNMLEHARRRRRLFIIFEYVDGTVLDYIEAQSSKRISGEKCREITWQVLRGLEFIHRNRMIHRDVKPENILYSKEGVAKLCDFGFARPNSIINGEVFTDYVATRWYRAPELIVKESTYDQSIDIWAVGCLLPEMLSGDALFPGESDVDQLYQVMSVCGPLPRDLHDSLRLRPEFYGFRFPEKQTMLEDHFRILRNLPVELEFIRKCLNLSPCARETACSLLTNSEYFLNDDFTRNKADLLEKIHRFNAPVRHIIPKQSKSDLKFPTSTSKIQLTNPQGKRNKHQKVNAANSNHRLEQLDAHNSGFSSMPVTLSMPEIKSNAKQRKQKQKWSKAGTQKQSQTKLPKL